MATADLKPGDIAAAQIFILFSLADEMRNKNAFRRALDQDGSIRKEKITMCGLEVSLHEATRLIGASKDFG
jgi:hypothetical protein